MIEARRFTARHAIMLVHSFNSSGAGFKDYTAFLMVLGGRARRNFVCDVGERSGGAWATRQTPDGDTDSPEADNPTFHEPDIGALLRRRLACWLDEDSSAGYHRA